MATVTTFQTVLESAKHDIEAAGFSTELWVPEFGWDASESEAAEQPHPAQVLAAYELFLHFFVRPRKCSWAHLAAEMQAGKTGVMTSLIRLVLSNARRLNIRPTRIFVLTGMGDNAWRKQTRQRLARALRENVHHNSGLDKVQATLGRLAGAEGLRDILIVLDESHIASNKSNRPNTLVYDTVRRLCPPEEWAARNIRFLTISATDPAKVLAMRGENPVGTAVVRLQTTAAYQSVESLDAAGRIYYVESNNYMDEVHRAIRNYTDPLYHFIRPSPSKYQATIDELRARYPTARVVPWDSKADKRSGDDETTTTSMEDINELLETGPEQMTFIVLKNMFYAAKTLHDEFVGVLCDRAGGKDDTNLQSLLGRACGYGKSTRTIVVTSRQTVQNYLRCWRELSARDDFPATLQGIPVKEMDRKMPFVRARKVGEDIQLVASAAQATPLAAGGAGGASDGPAGGRERANEDNFDSEWREFATMEEAKAWAPSIHSKKKDDAGFYLSSSTGSPVRLTYNEVLGMKHGKKTANLPWKALKVGGHVHRLYVAYHDTEDPTTAVFVVRRLTRLH